MYTMYNQKHIIHGSDRLASKPQHCSEQHKGEFTLTAVGTLEAHACDTTKQYTVQIDQACLVKMD